MYIKYEYFYGVIVCSELSHPSHHERSSSKQKVGIKIHWYTIRPHKACFHRTYEGLRPFCVQVGSSKTKWSSKPRANKDFWKRTVWWKSVFSKGLDSVLEIYFLMLAFFEIFCGGASDSHFLVLKGMFWNRHCLPAANGRHLKQQNFFAELAMEILAFSMPCTEKPNAITNTFPLLQNPLLAWGYKCRWRYGLAYCGEMPKCQWPRGL